MIKDFEYLILGGGLAAASALKELVRLKPGASVGVLGEERELPYDRPPLSKKFLLGKAERGAVFLLPKDFYSEKGIDMMLGRTAVAVDCEEHVVRADDGSEVGYGKLLIATGCRLRRLTLPGADLPGLYYLRTLAESEAIRKAAASARQAVVIGAGFIGLEVASVLSDLGIGVTIIHRSDRLFERFNSEEISSFYEEFYAARGVHTIFNDEAAALGGEGRLETVTTQAGRMLPCDMAVAGIGVFPDTGYLESSGLELGNGVVVDQYLRTRDADVYAAGDISNFYDPVYGRQRRCEHWDNAINQGALAGRNLTGADEAFRSTSYFYSTVFGMTFGFYGDLGDYDEMITRGSLENKSLAVLYLQQGVLQGAFMQGRPAAESNAVRRLISERRQLGAVQDRLADETFELEKVLVA